MACSTQRVTEEACGTWRTKVLLLIERGEAFGQRFRVALGEFGNGVDAGGFEEFAKFRADAVDAIEVTMLANLRIWVSGTPVASASDWRCAGVLALASSVSVSAMRLRGTSPRVPGRCFLRLQFCGLACVRMPVAKRGRAFLV